MGSKEPHIFALAEAAYTALTRGEGNQVGLNFGAESVPTSPQDPRQRRILARDAVNHSSITCLMSKGIIRLNSCPESFGYDAAIGKIPG